MNLLRNSSNSTISGSPTPSVGILASSFTTWNRFLLCWTDDVPYWRNGCLSVGELSFRRGTEKTGLRSLLFLRPLNWCHGGTSTVLSRNTDFVKRYSADQTPPAAGVPLVGASGLPRGTPSWFCTVTWENSSGWPEKSLNKSRVRLAWSHVL